MKRLILCCVLGADIHHPRRPEHLRSEYILQRALVIQFYQRLNSHGILGFKDRLHSVLSRISLYRDVYLIGKHRQIKSVQIIAGST